jgi:probable F420-dependent oxidoreductase
MPDHLGPAQPQLAPLVALGAAAAVSSRVRLAVTVLNNDFRHPTVLAKEIATLDLLSGGRVDLGIGAGWRSQDYESTGVATFDPPGVRFTRLQESIQLLKKLLSGSSVSFHGKYYSVDNHASFPATVQRPIPLMIGGSGRRMLSMAAREARIVSLIAQLGGDWDTRRSLFEQQLGWVRSARSSEQGAAELTLGLRIMFGQVLTAGADQEANVVTGSLPPGMSVEEAEESPFGLVGDLCTIKERILAIRERYGISYFTVSEDLGWAIAPVVAELASAERV